MICVGPNVRTRICVTGSLYHFNCRDIMDTFSIGEGRMLTHVGLTGTFLG